MSEDKATRAELAEAVRELREEVARLRSEAAAHHCHSHIQCCSHTHCNWGHCGCWMTHGSYITRPNISISPYTVTYGATSTVTTMNNSGYVNAASGCNPAVTTLSISN